MPRTACARPARPLPALDDLLVVFRGLVETWGRDPEFLVKWFMPGQRDNPSFLRWVTRYERQSASPADVRRQIESVVMLDAAEYLGQITAPTLVMNVAGDRIMPAASGRYLAAKIHGAIYVALEGEDHFCWVMPGWRKMEGRPTTGSQCAPNGSFDSAGRDPRPPSTLCRARWS
jgi:pimeloyl-ACP methyl ester carboxylesterase